MDRVQCAVCKLEFWSKTFKVWQRFLSFPFDVPRRLLDHCQFSSIFKTWSI